VRLKDLTIQILQTVSMESGNIRDDERQMELSSKLQEANGEFELTPEDVVLVRALISKTRLAPMAKVPLYRAFDPVSE
jgi:hypothetical protein